MNRSSKLPLLGATVTYSPASIDSVGKLSLRNGLVSVLKGLVPVLGNVWLPAGRFRAAGTGTSGGLVLGKVAGGDEDKLLLLSC